MYLLYPPLVLFKYAQRKINLVREVEQLHLRLTSEIVRNMKRVGYADTPTVRCLQHDCCEAILLLSNSRLIVRQRGVESTMLGCAEEIVGVSTRRSCF